MNIFSFHAETNLIKQQDRIIITPYLVCIGILLKKHLRNAKFYCVCVCNKNFVTTFNQLKVKVLT